MKRCLLVIGIFALASFSQAKDGDADFKETCKLISAMTDILKSVNDKAGAEAALPKLKPIDRRLVVLLKNENDAKPSAEEQKLAKATFKAFATELIRVKNIPEVKAVFARELALFKELEDASVTAAKAQIRIIEAGIQSYELKTSRRPKTLKALTGGNMPVLTAEAIIDPWKKPYQYDAAGPKNKGARADVWTITPEKKVIGNWK